MKFRMDQLFAFLLPVVVAVLPFAWYGATGSSRGLIGEFGIIENLTVLLLLVAIYYSINSLVIMKNNDLAPFQLRVWMVLWILGSVYFAGEEMSWGQHLFEWSTPEAWQEINNQKETNLHNTIGLLDQFPRLVLTIGIAVGGILIPLIVWFRKISLDETRFVYWLLPTTTCLPVSLLVILYKPLFKLTQASMIRTGEMKEVFIAMFIMIYAISIRNRLKRKNS